MPHRIHIFGASGSGTTTLGAALARRLAALHLDVDRFYWLPTDPPFTHKRPPAVRLAMLRHEMAAHNAWVLSGSLCGWGDALCERFTLAVFLRLDSSLRMARLLQREQLRYGDRIAPGGAMHANHCEFMAWAASYDSAVAPIRSLDLHDRWLAQLCCPVLTLDAQSSVENLVDEIITQSSARRAG